MPEPLLKIQGVSKTFYPHRGQAVKAVADITLDIRPGETLGLVGESGCGKTTLGTLAVGLQHPSAGHVLYRGVDIHNASGTQKRVLRRDIQMIFQDPRTSLNPCMTIGESIGEGPDIHGLARGTARRQLIAELLQMVGLGAPLYSRLPHQLSAGQRQRVGIARALAVNPRFLVCDEPLSALDVSMQAQIVNLLHALQRRLDLTLLFIAHNLTILRYIADRIAVMYGGRIIESAPRDELYANPLHPYTQTLMEAIAVPHADYKLRLPSPVPDRRTPVRKALSGCAFYPACPRALDICRAQAPPLTTNPAHPVACWHEYRGKKKHAYERALSHY